MDFKKIAFRAFACSALAHTNHSLVCIKPITGKESPSLECHP
jgi:hypothetical protein